MNNCQAAARARGMSVIVAIGVLAGACATTGKPAVGADAGASRGDGAFRTLRREAPELTSIPQLSTFAWVPPSVVFAGVSPADDERAMSKDVAELRDASSAVLRANGWRETTADSASFVLALVSVERTLTKQVMVPNPNNERTRPSQCAGLSREQRQVCREPAPRNYPAIARQTTVRDSRLSFAIVRVHDQATRLWLVNEEQRSTIARGTIDLLKAQAP